MVVSILVLVVVGTMVALGFAIAYVGRVAQRFNQAEVDRLGEALGLPAGSPFLVERLGRTFTASYAPPNKGAPARLTVTTPVDEPAEVGPGGAYRETGRSAVMVRPEILLRSEQAVDRLARRLGVSREIRTGDAAFDAAIHVASDSPEEDVQRTLAAAAFRDAVRELFASGVDSVRLDATGVSAVLVGPPPYAERFDRAAATLAQAAGALPRLGPGRAARSPVASAVVFVGVSTVVAVAIVLFPVYAIIHADPPIDASATVAAVGCGVALWILATLGAARVVRGRTTSLAKVVAFAATSLFVFPPGGYWAVCWANRALDTSPAVDHATTVTRSHGYHFEVASWRPGHAPVELTQSLAVPVTIGRRLVVTTHAGKLGWEWVDGYRPASR